MASDLLRAGLIGIEFGEFHLRSCQACPNVVVKTIGRQTAETAQRVVKDYSITDTHTDYRAILDRGDIGCEHLYTRKFA